MKRIDLQRDLNHLDRKIEKLLDPSPLGKFKGHRLQGEGKKQRGLLLLLLGGLFSVPREKSLTAAASVETVHLATLIHDDILDGAGRRRGKSPLHRVHGTAKALLYGDLLFTRGISAVNRLGHRELTDLLLATVREICSGEILEGEQRDRFPWEEKVYFQIIRRKTGALFQFSCQAPGLLAGISGNRLAGLGRLGMNLGCAYQIADDCLDFAPPSVASGKDRLADLRNGVPNLPLIIAGRTPALRREVARALGRDRSAATVEELGDLIRSSGTVARAAERAERFLNRAERVLAAIFTWRRSPVSAVLEGILDEQKRRIRQLRDG